MYFPESVSQDDYERFCGRSLDQFIADRLPQNWPARFVDGRQCVEGREDKARERRVKTSCDLEPTAVPLSEFLFQSSGVDNVDAQEKPERRGLIPQLSTRLLDNCRGELKASRPIEHGGGCQGEASPAPPGRRVFVSPDDPVVPLRSTTGYVLRPLRGQAIESPQSARVVESLEVGGRKRSSGHSQPPFRNPKSTIRNSPHSSKAGNGNASDTTRSLLIKPSISFTTSGCSAATSFFSDGSASRS